MVRRGQGSPEKERQSEGLRGREPGTGGTQKHRSGGFGQGAGARTGSHRVGYAPQEHAHQRIGCPEHLHLLLHEMLLLGFGGEAETRAWGRCRRRDGGRRDRRGRHGFPRPRLSECRWPRRGLPTPEALLTCAGVRGVIEAGPRAGRGGLAPPLSARPPPRRRAVGGHTWRRGGPGKQSLAGS